MTSERELETMLNDPAVDPRSWAAMVGGSWSSCYRVLHPAYRSSAPASPVPWARVRPGPDLAGASWFDVSGARLDSGATGDSWDIEPVTGPGDPNVDLLLIALLVGAFTTARMWLGEWSGTTSRSRLLSAGMKISVPGRDYVAVECDAESAVTAVAAREIEPYLAWSSDHTWILNADTDLASTVVGTARPRTPGEIARSGLEFVSVDPGSPIVL